MAFNPDEYLSKQTPSFNPDDYLAKMSVGDAAKIKFQEGATLGARPIVAGAGAAVGALQGALEAGADFDQAIEQARMAFTEARGVSHKEQEEAAKQHPNISRVASLAGGVVGGMGAGVAKVGAMGVGAIASGAQTVSEKGLPESPEETEELAINVGAGALTAKLADKILGSKGASAAKAAEKETARLSMIGSGSAPEEKASAVRQGVEYLLDKYSKSPKMLQMAIQAKLIPAKAVAKAMGATKVTAKAMHEFVQSDAGKAALIEEMVRIRPNKDKE